MTTPLFLLRCVQLGLSIGELDLLTIGLVNDMYVAVSYTHLDVYKRQAISSSDVKPAFSASPFICS